jgi:hypothetical protein
MEAAEIQELIDCAAASLRPHRCREFGPQIDPANLGTMGVLGSDRTTTLRELLPAHEWPQPEAVQTQEAGT